ncbi:HipA protein [Rhodospirillum rubrum F11]|nr:HipA protein [Rhodospirillum rubrum F11]
MLVVERFDRHWTADDRLLRLPQEDCCQALGVPPTLKYQAEGGPGIEALLNLLKGSDVPKVDQTRFLKATVAFWLLGATDGHAKNFSVFLSSGGRFRMTPLYDVISAQPSADAGQIPRNRMKLAMFVGTNRHYVIDTIMPRHFLQTAAAAGLGASLVEPVFADILATAPTALEDVMEALPKDFPRDIADSILGGFTERLRTLAKA